MGQRKGEEEVIVQGQHGYKEERWHEMCFYDSSIKNNEIDFSLLFLAK